MILKSATKAIRRMAFLTLWGGFYATSALAAPDAVAGKAKAQVCMGCHGETGVSSVPGVPHLAAQPPLSIFYQLVQFREQRRKGGGMEQIAEPLSDQDMRDLGAFYAALPAPPAVEAAAGSVAEGQRLSRQNYCQSCHGNNLQGQKHVPRIAGQVADYVVLQLKNLRSGARADMDGTMGSAARSLSDADIDALAAFAKSLQ